MDPWYPPGQANMPEAARRRVIRRGEVVASAPKRETALFLEGRPGRLDPADYARHEAVG
jgi:hypothetical protein